MSKIEKKQHIPIFVSSTFTDMVKYRKSVFDALRSLEPIVRGMEYLGASHNSPIEKCLKDVRSCNLYVGIFGMSYGSIPDGHEESMTHLEYNEAFQSEIPTLIYIIDEERQPLLAKHIETGPGAEKLIALKSILRKKHTCSLYTDPSDLGYKVKRDVPKALAEIGAKVEDFPGVPQSTANSSELIREFLVLPALLTGREIDFVFESDRFYSTSANSCEALELQVGATVHSHCYILCDGEEKILISIYASEEIARTAILIEKGSIVKATGKTVFGKVTTSEYDGERGYMYRDIDEKTGIQITKIEEILPTHVSD